MPLLAMLSPRCALAVVSSTGGATIWTGGSGVWSDTSQWQIVGGPSGGSVHAMAPLPNVFIDSGNSVWSTVLLDVDAAVSSMSIDEGDTLIIESSHWLSVGNTEINPNNFLLNAGRLQIVPGDEAGGLLIGGVGLFEIFGPGVIELCSSAHAQIISASGLPALHNAGSTIEGGGIIGNGTLALNNSGLIDANHWLETLTITPDAAGMVNSGILQASNGGILRLCGGTFVNNGVVRALDESYVELDTASLLGGALTTAGSGIVRVHYAPASMEDVHLNGRFELGPTRLTLRGSITNDGFIDVLAGDSALPPSVFSEIVLPPGSGDVTLDGSGMASLRWSKVHSGGASPGGRLIHGPLHTIAGEGLLGANTVGFINHGTLIADRANPIVIDPLEAQEVVNDGLFRAVGELGIVLTGGKFRNNGTIEVLPGSRCMYTATAIAMNVEDSALTGGTWRIIAGDLSAKIILPGAGIVFNNADVTLSGPESTFTLIDAMAFNLGRLAIVDRRHFTPQSPFFINEGQLVIGDESRLTVPGEFSQSDRGQLHFELSDDPRGSDGPRVIVQGNAEIGGTIVITIAGTPQSMAIDDLPLLSAAALEGNFANISAPPGVTVHYQQGQVLVDIHTSCVGDLNASGDVGIDDLLILLNNWGVCPRPPLTCAADLNGDGVVNVNDILVMLSVWGGCK